MNDTPGLASRRVVVVDDHVLLAESLAASLSGAGWEAVPVTLPAADTGLLAEIVRLRPALVVLDLDLGQQGDARRVIRPLLQHGVAVVVLTGSTRQSDAGECLALGARAVLPKTLPLSEVRSVVRRVMAGTPVLARAEREDMIAGWRAIETESRRARRALATLSGSERTILALLRHGCTVPDIARRRQVSVHTVRSQVKAIRHKLGVSSQVAAVALMNRAQRADPGDAAPWVSASVEA